MRNFKIDNKGSGGLFSNKILEGLTRTNFYVPVIFYLAVGLFFAIYTYLEYSVSVISFLLLIPAGMILFTLVEYLIHRFVFHFKASTEKEKDLQYIIHGIHHEFPRDKDRLVMPPVISILLAALFFILFRFSFGINGLLLFAGFVSGYSIYLLIHYAVHALRPPNNFLKIFWKHHSLHHYSSVNSAFSVSFPFWDRLFGTMPSPSERNESRLPDSMKASIRQ